MWSLAFSSLRFRWLSFVGVFVTVMAAATLVTATGSLLEGGIRGSVESERLSGADIVVAADQGIRETRGHGEDRETVSATAIERVRVPTDLTDKISSVPGVADVVADVSFPAYVVVDGEQVARSGRGAVTGPLVDQCLDHSLRADRGCSADRSRRGRDRLRAGQQGRSRCR